MTGNPEHNANMARVTIAWMGTLFWSVTMSGVALMLTIVYTRLNIFKLGRDLWRQRRSQKGAQ